MLMLVLNRALCSWAFSSVLECRTTSLWRHVVLDEGVFVYLGVVVVMAVVFVYKLY